MSRVKLARRVRVVGMCLSFELHESNLQECEWMMELQ
jgi:hypothetical protein